MERFGLLLFKNTDDIHSTFVAIHASCTQNQARFCLKRIYRKNILILGYAQRCATRERGKWKKTSKLQIVKPKKNEDEIKQQC